MPRLFHISEDPNVKIFEPRPSYRKDIDEKLKMVWSVSEDRMINYLFPRNCPRVTFYAMANSSAEDIKALMGYSSAKSVAAIESRWLSEMQNTTIYIYEFNPENFVIQDETAGYYISSQPEIPISVTTVTNVLNELLKHNVEVRIMPSLWDLRDAVVNSSLGYSAIRMGFASPRTKE